MSVIKVIKDHKFKNTMISVRFLSPLQKETILPKILLANMLNDVCEKYDTKQKVSEVLDEMYGSTYSASSSIIGDAQVFVAKVKTIHSKFINQKQNLLEAQFQLLQAFLLKPLQVDGSFCLTNVEEAKRIQKSYMQRTLDDPNSFCMLEAMKIAGKDQPLGLGVQNGIADIDLVSVEDINTQYQAMLENDKIDILVFGDVDENEVNALANKYLEPLLRERATHKVNYCLKYHEMPKIQYGYKDISQSYITSIYASNIANDEAYFKVLRVANAIFGQLPSSLLFQNVREKNSLCYSIYSAINPYDGMLGVSTGVDVKNVDKALALINEQFEAVVHGNFDDELIETSKKMIINSLLSSNDDMDSIVALSYRNIILQKEESLEQLIQGINEVKKEDIMRVMSGCQYIMSYVLTQKGETHE